MTSRATAARSSATNGCARVVDLRVHQQVVDQRAHAGRRVEHALEVFARVAVERRSGRRAQPLAERQDLAQRLLQVVRRDGRELVERRVRALQLAALVREPPFRERRSVMSSIASRMMRGASGPCATSRALSSMILRPIPGKHVVDFEVVRSRSTASLSRSSSRSGAMSHWPSPSVKRTSPIVSSARRGTCGRTRGSPA